MKKILTNYTYTGNLVQGKNRITAVNTHEPIIPAEVFDAIQKKFSTTESCRKVERAANLLRGKVICEYCGSKMQRKRGAGKADWFFFTCITKNRRGAEYCDGTYIRESDILCAIRQEIQTIQPEYLASVTLCKGRISEIKKRLHDLAQVNTPLKSTRMWLTDFLCQHCRLINSNQNWNDLKKSKRHLIPEYCRFVAKVSLSLC